MSEQNYPELKQKWNEDLANLIERSQAKVGDIRRLEVELAQTIAAIVDTPQDTPEWEDLYFKRAAIRDEISLCADELAELQARYKRLITAEPRQDQLYTPPQPSYYSLQNNFMPTPTRNPSYKK